VQNNLLKNNFGEVRMIKVSFQTEKLLQVGSSQCTVGSWLMSVEDQRINSETITEDKL
jgi:hypothetical protein